MASRCLAVTGLQGEGRGQLSHPRGWKWGLWIARAEQAFQVREGRARS